MFRLTNHEKRDDQARPMGLTKREESGKHTEDTEKTPSRRISDERIREIEEQRYEMMRRYPSFDMDTELQNRDFVRYLFVHQLSVEEAYFLVHAEELLEEARNEAAEELASRGKRIAENGTAKNRPVRTNKSPKDFSDEEVDEIIERARKGERITF